jgi:hypothetical protein
MSAIGNVPEQPSADEATALLADHERQEHGQNGTQDESSSRQEDEEESSYDRKQVLILSLCGLADPISFFCIVPFVPQMIFELGNIKKSEVGFYSGLIVSKMRRPPLQYAHILGITVFYSTDDNDDTMGQSRRQVRSKTNSDCLICRSLRDGFTLWF